MVRFTGLKLSAAPQPLRTKSVRIRDSRIANDARRLRVSINARENPGPNPNCLRSTYQTMELNPEQYPDQSTFMKAARAAGFTKTVEALKDVSALWIAESLARHLEEKIIAVLKECKAIPRNELYKKLRGDNHSSAFNEALRRLQRDTIIITYKDSSVEALRKKGRRSEIIELLDSEPLPADVQQIVKDMREVKEIGEPIKPVITLKSLIEKSKSFAEVDPMLTSIAGQEPDIAIADDIKREILRPRTGYKITGAPEPIGTAKLLVDYTANKLKDPEATGSTSPLPEAPSTPRVLSPAAVARGIKGEFYPEHATVTVSKSKSALISALGAGE